MMTKTLLLAALLTLAVPAGAETRFSPAGFGNDEKSLGNLIEFPELRGDTSVTISCAGILSARGKFDQHGCYEQNPGDKAFIGQIYKAARKAKLEPATWEGKAVEVIFQYRIHFEQKDDEQKLFFMANSGYAENVEAYGLDHVGAQRLTRKEDWQKSCPRQNRFVVVARANVDWEGRPSAVTIKHTGGLPITANCEQALADNLLASRFIPAFDDGEPVPSTFMEPFGN